MGTETETCSAMGLLFRDGSEVSVAMEWHMAHSLSAGFQKDFLKTRCRALQEAFGDLKNVRGIGSIAISPEGVRVSYDDKVVSHPSSCEAMMGFVWPGVDDEKWQVLKEKFKEVFEPAVLHGGVHCNETDNAVHISSRFELAEKGGD